MKRLLGMSLCALALGACQTTGGEHTAPLCSGKNRRPMNIYPSVLPNLQGTAAVSAAAAPAVMAPVAAAPERDSAAGAVAASADPTVYPSCE